MILLNKYCVLYICLLCIIYVLEEISCELLQNRFSVPIKDGGGREEKGSANLWLDDANPKNFTHLSRGRLKKDVSRALKSNYFRVDGVNISNLSAVYDRKSSSIHAERSVPVFSDLKSKVQPNKGVNISFYSSLSLRSYGDASGSDNRSQTSGYESDSVNNRLSRNVSDTNWTELDGSFSKLEKSVDSIPDQTNYPAEGPAREFSRHRIIKPQLFHARTKRDISTTWNSEGHLDHLTLGLNLGEKDILLDLYLNRNLLPEGYFEKSFSNISKTINRPKPEEVGLCHYQGFIKDVAGSWAAVSTCNGVRGMVFDGEDTHYLEPIPSVTRSPTDPHYHLSHNDLLQRNLTCGYVGRPNHPVKDLFHDEIYKRLLRYKRDASEGSIRGPFNANSLSRYVELVLVADKTEFEKHNSDVNKIYERCKDIANIVNALYQPLNIFIALVGVEVWQEEDPVEISTDGDKTLTNFLNYRKVRLIPEHPNDNAQLLTGKVFDSGVVGKALKGPICTYQYSGGVNMDHSDSVGLVATTVAHEMGHNFGMEHDNEEDCKCPDKRCIMAPSSGTKSPSHWSSCSHEYLAISFERSMDYCLRNRPLSLFDSPVCGNGFVEAGEQCDCGLEEHCNNPCCNATTCMLFANATCATGHCCDLQTCRPRVAGMECRAALHECDLPEYCSGDSEYCPENFYKEDGYPCLGGKAYCYEGMCRTHEHQCRLLWGPTGKNSHDKCYNLNREGNTHGNCGYNWANNTYKKCETHDIKCGMMHCKHFNERLEFGMESVSKVSHRFIADKTQGVIPCRVAQVDLGLDMVDPGLAPDGAKCGYNKMCVGQRCLEVSSLRKYVCSCNGRGVCNNLGHCHCKVGFAWPDCKYPGLGGSEDSGPASNPHATNQFVVGMFVFFLGVVPLCVLVLCLVYYVRGNFKIWLTGKGRPIDSRLSGLDSRRGTTLCVEVVTKSSTDGSGVQSPSPPSSHGSKSNSPLLNGHANGVPNATFSTQFFGKHEGFTLSPIKEKPNNGSATPGTVPSSSCSSEAPVVSSNTTPAISHTPWKPKPISQTAYPISSTVGSSTTVSKPSVDISGPSLQTSTNPAVKVSSPIQNTLTPTRQAPQRPKSVPDASSLVIESIPLSGAEVSREQGKPSTVSRIASFLSKRERAESAPPEEPPKCNTLPRKAAKINRESLLQLEISHPMQLQATELPNNLVPVRPAPEPPMPSNLKPSEVKSNQEKTTLGKVSWAPDVGEMAKEPKEKSDIARVGSVREPSVTSRPQIPKFGSMRAPRPKSLPPPRPSQPPPRPPLPMIPGTPETEYFYDDCITVQVAAPLAHEEGVSPLHEGIYATIDEDSPDLDVTFANTTEVKKEKKNIFSMLYAKTKKKKATESNEPLYCNIESVQVENKKNKDSSNTPSPVIADRESCGSNDEGGLLSEIVTELVTREPQYMNTLSKNSKSTSPVKGISGSLKSTPDKSEVSQNLVKSSSSLSPLSKKSPSSPDGEKSKPYIPYSNLKPRGVFSFFNKSPSLEEEKTVVNISSNQSPDELEKIESKTLPKSKSVSDEKKVKENFNKSSIKTSSSLSASLAEVKAASAFTKSTVQKGISNSSSPNVEVTPLNNNEASTPQSSDNATLLNNSSKNKASTATNISGNQTNSSRPRPHFPPDKVINSGEKSSKPGNSGLTKKQSLSNTDVKSGVAAKGKGSSTSTGKSKVPSLNSKLSPQVKDSTVKPSGVKSSNLNKYALTEKEINNKALNVAGAKKSQTLATKPDSKSRIASGAATTKSTASEVKPTLSKKTGRLASPPSIKPLGASTTAKSNVLAAAAKSGPLGSSNVASLQQKFEKEGALGAKSVVKGPVKKSSGVGRGTSKETQVKSQENKK